MPPHTAYSHNGLLLVEPRTVGRYPKPVILVQDTMDQFAPVLDPSLLGLRLVQLAPGVDLELVEVAVGPAEYVLDEAVDEVEIVVRGHLYGSEDFESG